MTSNSYGPVDLTPEPITPERPAGIWWKIYFIIQTIMSLSGFIVAFSLLRFNAETIRESIIFLLAAIGTCGFAFNSRSWHPKFWRYFFYFFVIYLIYSLVAWAIWYLERGDTMTRQRLISSISANTIGFLFDVPACIALYRYSSPRKSTQE